MSDRFRTKVLSRLEEEINHLSGGAFEQFGYKVMPLIKPGDWGERGTTGDGAPRKGTVDTSSNAAAYVGEMSSLEGYFDGKLLKPKADLKHALAQHPQVEHIWLLSSRTPPTGKLKDIENVASEFIRSHPSVKSATILGAPRIAALIFDHLGKRDLASALSHYLPSLLRLTEEHGFSHAIPSITTFTPRHGVEASIITALRSSSYVILQGMSGIGKTALAARIAHLQKDAFDNRIWLDARDIDGVRALESVALARSGVSHNIAGLIRNERILLVIDDPAFPLSELTTIQYGASNVIVTAQVASGPNVIPISDLGRQEAENVLTAGVGHPCPPAVLARVFEAAGGHPLILNALNRLAFEYSWDDVLDCVATASISELQDERSQNIFRRILRHQTELAYELQFIRWIRSRRVVEELANAASSLLVGNLSKRGFLAATTPGYVRVHDLVYSAIEAEIAITAHHEDRIRQRISAFIRSESDSDRLLLQRIARVHDDFFARLALERAEPEFIYIVAMRRTGVESIGLLGDPVSAAATLSQLPSLAERTPEIRSVIEVVEALFTLRATYRSRDEARANLEREIQALSLLGAHAGITPAQRTMLRYHRAKMLPRLDRKNEVNGTNEAIAIFRDLLEQDPSNAAARNQLAKILPASGSITESEEVLKQHVENPSSVNWNVVLDSFRLLIRHRGDMAKHESALMAAIEHAKGIDLSEAVRLVVSVDQRAWFNAPQLLVPMFNALELSDAPTGPSEAFNRAQVHKFAAMESEGALTRNALLVESLRLYQLAKLTNEYEHVHYAEALVLAGQHQRAIDVLSAVPSDKRSAFWWQRSAEALSGIGMNEDAVVAIDHAIATIPDPSLLADFHRSRFRIRRAAGDPQADLSPAIGCLPSEHPFRRKLEAEQRAAAKHG